MPDKIFIQNFIKGDEIIKAGQKGRNAYFIEMGQVEVFALQNNIKHVIATLGPGEVFGEMSMIDDAPRSANVVAIEDTEVIVIERSRFKRPILSADPIMQLLLRVLLTRFRESQDIHKGIQDKTFHNKGSIKKLRDLAFDRIHKERDLRQAFDSNELELHYQPIINLKTDKIAGFEALIRWQKDSKFILPSSFMPLAEESGFVTEMGRWIIQKGLSDFEKIDKLFSSMTKHSACPFMSLNVSAIQLSNLSEIQKISKVISDSKTNPSSIKLEITESFMFEDPSFAKKALGALKELGVSLTIDDFGTGYSSLSYLHKYPFDTLKIDQSFIKNMEQSNDSFRIVNCIIQLANALNLSIVAEGIETKSQYQKLKSLGCQFGQGFYMSRPQNFLDIMSLVSKEPNWHK